MSDEDNTIPAPKASVPPTETAPSEPPKSRRSRRTKAQMTEARGERTIIRPDRAVLIEPYRSVRSIAMSYMPTFIALIALALAIHAHFR